MFRLTCSLFVCGMVFSMACKPATSEQASQLPSGRYLNRTVLQACPDKMPVDVPHYCLEMNFNGKDSVTLDNGFEVFTLPVTATKNENEFSISKATLYGDMLFLLASDSTIVLLDTAWTKQAGSSSFAKITQGSKSEWSFSNFLNDCIIAGDGYAWFKQGNLIPGAVTFSADGQIKGMGPYVKYELCYAGDCLEETDPPSRTMDLIDDKGNRETYSMKTVEGKMAIELYKIGDPVPDQKGGRPIGAMVHELRTE